MAVKSPQINGFIALVEAPPPQGDGSSKTALKRQRQRARKAALKHKEPAPIITPSPVVQSAPHPAAPATKSVSARVVADEKVKEPVANMGKSSNQGPSPKAKILRLVDTVNAGGDTKEPTAPATPPPRITMPTKMRNNTPYPSKSHAGIPITYSLAAKGFGPPNTAKAPSPPPVHHVPTTAEHSSSDDEVKKNNKKKRRAQRSVDENGWTLVAPSKKEGKDSDSSSDSSTRSSRSSSASSNSFDVLQDGKVDKLKAEKLKSSEKQKAVKGPTPTVVSVIKQAAKQQSSWVAIATAPSPTRASSTGDFPNSSRKTSSASASTSMSSKNTDVGKSQKVPSEEDIPARLNTTSVLHASERLHSYASKAKLQPASPTLTPPPQQKKAALKVAHVAPQVPTLDESPLMATGLPTGSAKFASPDSVPNPPTLVIRAREGTSKDTVSSSSVKYVVSQARVSDMARLGHAGWRALLQGPYITVYIGDVAVGPIFKRVAMAASSILSKHFTTHPESLEYHFPAGHLEPSAVWYLLVGYPRKLADSLDTTTVGFQGSFAKDIAILRAARFLNMEVQTKSLMAVYVQYLKNETPSYDEIAVVEQMATSDKDPLYTSMVNRLTHLRHRGKSASFPDPEEFEKFVKEHPKLKSSIESADRYFKEQADAKKKKAEDERRARWEMGEKARQDEKKAKEAVRSKMNKNGVQTVDRRQAERMRHWK